MPRKIPYEEVKRYIEEAGHKLLTTKEEYMHTNQELDILCPDGHVYQRTFRDFKHGNQRCSERSCIEARKKQTNMERYGFEHPAQSPIVKEKMIATNLEVRGVRNPSQDPLVKEKKEATNLERRNVKNPFQDPIVKERITAVHLTTRGVTNVSRDPVVQERRRQTMIELYGVENAMHNAEIAQRAFDNAHKSKPYTLPSGRVISIQGYENWYLDQLFNVDKYPEDDVIFGSEIAKLPAIYYVFGGTSHRYFPDVVLVSREFIVEIKSPWTYDGGGKQEEEYIKRKEQVHAKLDASFALGFNTLLIVYNKKGDIAHHEYKMHPSSSQP